MPRKEPGARKRGEEREDSLTAAAAARTSDGEAALRPCSARYFAIVAKYLASSVRSWVPLSIGARSCGLVFPARARSHHGYRCVRPWSLGARGSVQGAGVRLRERRRKSFCCSSRCSSRCCLAAACRAPLPYHAIVMLPYGKRKRLDDDEQPALISSSSSSSSSSTASSQKRSRGEVADPSALDDDEYAHETADNLIFEDPYADDMDDSGEEVVQDEEDDDDDDEDDEEDPHHAMDGEGDVDDDDAEQLADHEVDDETDEPPRVWRPGIDQLQEGEVLDYDSTAYDMFHTLQVEWPCLSFGIVRDKLGFHRTKVRALSSRQRDISDTAASCIHVDQIMR